MQGFTTQSKEKRFEVYSHIRAEIKSTRFDGVQFFYAMPVEVYQKSNSQLYFQRENNEKAFNVLPVGVVTYEWIENIDLDGD